MTPALASTTAEERRAFVRALAFSVLQKVLREVGQAEHQEPPVEAQGQPGAAA